MYNISDTESIAAQRLRNAGEFSKQAIKKLLQHQLQAREPVYAPWYRAASKSKALGCKPYSNPTRSTGTGVWIPSLRA